MKHAVPLGDWRIGDSARDAVERGLADALIVSGTGTGLAADRADVEAVRAMCPSAKLLLGSGVTLENLADYLPLADGFIVGSAQARRQAVRPAWMRNASHLWRGPVGIRRPKSA